MPEIAAQTKKWIKRGLVAGGITSLAAGFGDRQVAILMYHSVLERPERQRYTLGRIMHDAKVFGRQMETIARDYVAVTLDEVLLFMLGKKELPRHAVAVTFDDGYLDNYEVAMPILDRTGIPGTFYVTVDCVETGKLPWPSRLRYAFHTTRLKSWKDRDGMEYPLSDELKRESAFLRCCDYCATLAGDSQEYFLATFERELEIDAEPSQKGLMMNWDHVRALSARGHVIGSHTMTHPNMAHIPDDQAWTELSESKRRLEGALGTSIPHFSYPCPALSPHWKESTVELSRRAGYLTAVIAGGGSVRQKDDPLRLRRVGARKQLEDLRWTLECSFIKRTRER